MRAGDAAGIVIIGRGLLTERLAVLTGLTGDVCVGGVVERVGPVFECCGERLILDGPKSCSNSVADDLGIMKAIEGGFENWWM